MTILLGIRRLCESAHAQQIPQMTLPAEEAIPLSYHERYGPLGRAWPHPWSWEEESLLPLSPLTAR
jgi:hypothetical protein